MANRWIMLAVLFFARLTMAFQFQVVAALSPLIAETYGLSLADIGFLIGVYLAPGVIVAIPGGAIAARFGEKRVVGYGMVLMLIGCALMAFGGGWAALVAGRLIAGAGGVILNIVMTKMLVDWFTGHEISTALAVFVNSWPVGIALALLVLPGAATLGGITLAWAVVLSLIALGLTLFLLVYHPPENAVAAAPRIKVQKLPWGALSLAAMIWVLYNTALAMVFSFGPALLLERGWTLAAAGSATSLFMIVFSLSVPLGGIVADRTGRRDAVIMASLLGYALLMPVALFVSPPAITVIFAIVGVVFGFAAGPIMSLPAVVLRPETRTFGMGVFFSIYYGVMMIAPALAGKAADLLGWTGIVFLIGAAMMVASMALLALFRRESTREKELKFD